MPTCSGANFASGLAPDAPHRGRQSRAATRAQLQHGLPRRHRHRPTLRGSNAGLFGLEKPWRELSGGEHRKTLDVETLGETVPLSSCEKSGPLLGWRAVEHFTIRPLADCSCSRTPKEAGSR
jgi:hypothetical protein